MVAMRKPERRGNSKLVDEDGAHCLPAHCLLMSIISYSLCLPKLYQLKSHSPSWKRKDALWLARPSVSTDKIV